jgi:hypothetical protein
MGVWWNVKRFLYMTVYTSVLHPVDAWRAWQLGRAIRCTETEFADAEADAFLQSLTAPPPPPAPPLVDDEPDPWLRRWQPPHFH